MPPYRPQVSVIATDDFDVALRLWISGRMPVYLKTQIAPGDKRPQRWLLLDARRQGVAHAELSKQHPEMLDELLDWPGAASHSLLALRRICLALRLPATPLAHLGRIAPGESRRAAWLSFARQLAFWSGVKACTDRREWALITRGADEVQACMTVIGLSAALCDTAV